MSSMLPLGRISRLAMTLGAAFVAAPVLAGCDIGTITDVDEVPWQQDTPTGWAQVTASPTKLEVVAYVTGEVFAGGGVLIDPSIDGVPSELGEDQWVPSLSYLVTHPDGTNVLLDTGARAGECGYKILVVLDFPCRNKPGQDVVTQLARDGVEKIDYLVSTHFHGDHSSGLGPVLARYDPVVIASQDELDALRGPLREVEGYRYDQFAADMRVEAADNGWLEMPGIGKAADILGDGSIWLLPTPGHTPGHMSVLLNAAEQPILMTFDAAHLKATYDFNAPGGLGADLETASKSIDDLKALAAELPDVRLIYGHEPAQWQTDEIRVELISALDRNQE